MLRCKQTLGVQLLLELLESNVQITDTVRHQTSAVKLIRSVPRIGADFTESHNLHAVFRAEAEIFGRTGKQHTAQGTLAVLQCKIMMTGGIDLIVGYLASDQNSA